MCVLLKARQSPAYFKIRLSTRPHARTLTPTANLILMMTATLSRKQPHLFHSSPLRNTTTMDQLLGALCVPIRAPRQEFVVGERTTYYGLVTSSNTTTSQKSVPTRSRRELNDAQAFSRLPIEIITQIFIYCLSDRPHPSSVMRLGAICSTLRHIAWSCGELWATLCIPVEYTEYEPKRQGHWVDLQMLREWMGRTGTVRPVTLSVQCSVFTLMRHDRCPFRPQPELLQFLSEYNGRWGRLELQIPQLWLSKFKDYNFSNLKSIHLIPFEIEPEIPRMGDGNAFQWTLPQLVSAEVCGLVLSSNSMPWDRLVSVSLSDVKAESAIAVWPLLKRAVDVKISIAWGGFDNRRLLDLEKWQASLPALKRLSIYAEDPAFATHLLDWLKAPRMQSITVYMDPKNLHFLALSIQSLVERCRLRGLDVVVDPGQSGVDESQLQPPPFQSLQNYMLPDSIRFSYLPVSLPRFSFL